MRGAPAHALIEARLGERLRLLERVADRLRERPEPEPSTDRLADVDRQEVGHLGVSARREPEGQVAPGLDPVLDEVVLVHPGEPRVAPGLVNDRLEHGLHRQRPIRPCRVEDPGLALLGHVQQPVRQIPRMDELHGLVARLRGEHVAAACDAVHPVREAPAHVVRADDEPCAHGERPTREGALELALAEHLEPAVHVRAGDFLGRLVLEHVHPRGLVRAGERRVRVDGGARHERVVADAVAEERRGLAHPAGHAGRGVDDGVPAPCSKTRQVAGGAVAVQRLDVRVEAGRRLPAVEERHLVAARLGALDQVSPDEERPAENEDPHRTSSPLTRHS